MNGSADCTCTGRLGTIDIVLPVVLMSRTIDQLCVTQANIPHSVDDQEFLRWLRGSYHGLDVKTTNCFMFFIAVARKIIQSVNNH
jgi:hypothetical protein